MIKTKQQSSRNYIMEACAGILVLFIYFFFSNFQGIFLELCNINPDTISIGVKVFYLVSWEILMIALIMLLLHKKLEHDMHDMKKNHQKYYQKYFKYWLGALGIMMVSNAIIALLSNGGISQNETVIRDNFAISPLYVYISAVWLAPVLEELVFRQGIRNIIPIDSFFILLSGLVFGVLHVVTSMTSAFDLLYLIPYCAPGFAFAYMLTKTDNIFVSMGLHFMHNGILISLQFILLFFG